MDEPAAAVVEKRAMFKHTQSSPVNVGGVQTDAAWPKPLRVDEQEARRVPETLGKMERLKGKCDEAAKHLVEETVDDEDAARRRVAELFVEKTFAEVLHNSGHERPEQKAFDSPSTTVSEFVRVPWYEQEPNPLYYILTRGGRALLKDPVDKHFIQRLRETVLGQRYGTDAFPDAKEQSPEARAIELVETELWNHRALGRYDSRDRAIRALEKARLLPKRESGQELTPKQFELRRVALTVGNYLKRAKQLEYDEGKDLLSLSTIEPIRSVYVKNFGLVLAFTLRFLLFSPAMVALLAAPLRLFFTYLVGWRGAALFMDFSMFAIAACFFIGMLGAHVEPFKSMQNGNFKNEVVVGWICAGLKQQRALFDQDGSGVHMTKKAFWEKLDLFANVDAMTFGAGTPHGMAIPTGVTAFGSYLIESGDIDFITIQQLGYSFPPFVLANLFGSPTIPAYKRCLQEKLRAGKLSFMLPGGVTEAYRQRYQEEQMIWTTGFIKKVLLEVSRGDDELALGPAINLELVYVYQHFFN